ncbi:hypothetical protein K491DRAFT_592374 [Lophiostoma macrostomum CBS 122681]|uniref:Uncharacterized protein n=1 Tax=Lophiostoma macrostomum CBS 122681 TaxID=1314788 RepID=A0A6A6TJM9_9PLEO|nr:hypothetical protein K491DRAFT_592374 [Lophiostoma macrostomum CBS 122681]
MLSASQPLRPKPPQQDPRPNSAYQQKRAIHEQLPPQPQSSFRELLEPYVTHTFPRPRNQIEAMPPSIPVQPAYDSAVRHPVFFTEQLRKPPFPVPEVASRGYSPVAKGYIMECRRVDANGAPRTKL